MKTIASTKTIRLAGTAVLAVASLSAVVGISLTHSKKTQLIATGEPVILDHSCAPTLSSGAATQLDVKGVTWEYSNCADSLAGHVQVNHQGYFGVSASSAYGFTGITEITVTFSPSTDCELWLLKSVDGVNWGEECILTTDEAVTGANGWRYIRFYNWSDNNTAVDVESVSISYSCTGISAAEDLDSAKDSNVLAVSENLTHQAETAELSPNSVGGEAVRFIKPEGSTASTNLTIKFNETYKIGDIQNAAIEFDMKTSNINYGKTIMLMNGSSQVGSTVDSSKGTSYKFALIAGSTDWYHIQVPISAFITTISGWTDGDKKVDIPAPDVANKKVNGIKINAGSCVIDNLRIGSSLCDIGNYNNPTYKPKVGEHYWVKTSWVGKLFPEQCKIQFSNDGTTFSDESTIGRYLPYDDSHLVNGSPFYIDWLTSGTVTIKVSVVCGYNRSSYSLTKTITIQ